MHSPGFDGPTGTVETLWIDSEALAGNRLGAPVRRRVDVYRPAEAPESPPLLVELAPWGSSALAQTGWRGRGETTVERLDRLITHGTMPPVVVAFPDTWLWVGGNQHISSPVTGDWESFLAQEMLPQVEALTGAGGPGRRGLFGKSSGGYGAVCNLMRAPDVWAAAASHAGDMGFDLCYRPDFPALARALARHGGAEGLIRAYQEDPRAPWPVEQAMMLLALSGTYDPAPDQEGDAAAPFGFRAPFDPQTCEMDAERWQAWMAHDPLRLAPQHPDALNSARLLWIDCGTEDEVNLLYGARRLSGWLKQQGIAHQYHEFAGGHRGLDHRYDVSLPALARALA